MNLADYKKLSIDGIELKDLTINSILAWKAKTFTNLIPLSTEADGKTIYNGGLGYKFGYRVRSGGAEISAENNIFCIGFIPFKLGDVLRMYTPSGFAPSGAVSSINLYDIGYNNIGQTAYNGSYGIMQHNSGLWSNCVTVDNNGMMTFTLPNVKDIDKVAFIRITNKYPFGIAYSEEIKQTVYTVNEQIE